MLESTRDFVFVGFGKRVVAALIDAAIGWAFMPLTNSLMSWSILHRTILPEVSWSVAWTVLWLWLVVRFGGTPGKLIIGARIVDAHGGFLSWKRAILRVLPSLVIYVNFFLQMGVALGRYPDSATHTTFMETIHLVNVYGEPYASLNLVLSLFIYVDIGTILFNAQKRAIHDFIAGSYVITRASCEATYDTPAH
jgi:uncharacterized RDD family membrane protein YckC